MAKYHVLSMNYVVDVTLFIPKSGRIFYFYGRVHTYDCCLVITAQRRSLLSVVTLVVNITHIIIN